MLVFHFHPSGCNHLNLNNGSARQSHRCGESNLDEYPGAAYEYQSWLDDVRYRAVTHWQSVSCHCHINYYKAVLMALADPLVAKSVHWYQHQESDLQVEYSNNQWFYAVYNVIGVTHHGTAHCYC